MAEERDHVRTMPQEGEIARAIASVPGVAAAEIVRPADGGRSRLMLRLQPGEDEQRVAWAVAATLRERFDIDLDPDAIRPRPTPEPAADGLALVDDGELSGEGSSDDAGPGAGSNGASDAGATAPGPAAAAASSPAAAAASSPAAPTVPARATAVPDASAPQPPQPQVQLWSARQPPPPAPTDAPAPSEPPAPVESSTTSTAPAPPTDGHDEVPTPPSESLASTRERLRRAVEDALTTLGEHGPAEELAAHAGEDAREDTGTPPPAPAPVPGVSAEPVLATDTRVPRAAIDHLEIHRGVEDVAVAVTLRHDERRAAGRARSVHTSRGRLRAVAEATVAALDGLVTEPLMVTVDRIVATDSGDDLAINVVLTMVEGGQEHRLLGGALVRDEQDTDGAVVRATLDALNRQVTPLLGQAVTPEPTA